MLGCFHRVWPLLGIRLPESSVCPHPHPLELDLGCSVEFTACVWFPRGVLSFLSSLVPVLRILLSPHTVPARHWEASVDADHTDAEASPYYFKHIQASSSVCRREIGSTFCPSLSTRRTGCYCFIIYRR